MENHTEYYGKLHLVIENSGTNSGRVQCHKIIKSGKLKKGKSFMSQEDRMKIISALKCVDEVFLSIDKDKTQCESLKYLKPHIFAKGGDRMSSEIPESGICKKLGIQIVDQLGEKIRSSSTLTGMKEIK